MFYHSVEKSELIPAAAASQLFSCRPHSFIPLSYLSSFNPISKLALPLHEPVTDEPLRTSVKQQFGGGQIYFLKVLFCSTCSGHSSQQVRIKGGGGITPFRPKMTPFRLPLSAEALISEKITKKRQNIAKKAKSCSKVLKIGLNGLFK
jgi:hypothetical protein